MAVFMIALFGPFFSFAQLAVYDIYALFLFMIGLVLAETKKVPYILLGGIFAGLAIITKYAFIIFFPCLLVLLMLLERKHWFRNAFLLGISAGTVVIIHNLLVFDWIFPVSYTSYEALKVGFNSLYSLGICLFILFPFIFLLIFSRAKIELQAQWKWLFIVALLVWPAFHLLTENPVSAQKHLIYALTFSAPLLVFSFKKAWTSGNRLVPITTVVFFVFQYGIIFQTWSDLGPANELLQDRVNENSTIISNMGTYRTRYALFDKMPDVSKKLRNYHELPDSTLAKAAAADFIIWKEVEDPELTAWMESQKQYYKEIGSYEDFFIGSGDNLTYGAHTLHISVYQKK